MKNQILLLVLLTFLVACKHETFTLGDDYYFPNYSGKITKLHQAADTLYEYNFNYQQPADTELLHRYKIISTKHKNEYSIVKLEEITASDTISNMRFFAFVLKKYEDSQLGFLNYARHYTKSEIDTLNPDTDVLDIAFYYTYYNSVQFDQILRQKKLTTPGDAARIVSTIFSHRFDSLAMRYANTDLPDFYGNGFEVEVVNRACIELGFNPCGTENILRETIQSRQ